MILGEKDFEGAAWLNDFIDKLSKATGAAPSGFSGEQLAAYEMDYLIMSSVSARDRQFTATVTLQDHHHGQTVKSGSFSWSGEFKDFGAGFTAWVDATFNPLDDVIYAYERKPQLCRITLEGTTQSIVQAGDTVTFRLTEIFDHQSHPSQRWQRVYVKAGKGKILNGREKGEYRVFEVGDGNIGVTYKAPDACKPDEDTITVYNTCYTKDNPDGTPADFGPDKELAKKEFNIVCDQYEVKLTYEETLNDQEGTVGSLRRTVGHTYSATAKARVAFVRAQRNEAIYESKSTQLDLNDTFNQHWIAEKGDMRCDARINWTGTHNGDFPVKLILKFNTHGHRYAVGWGKGGGQVTYRVALNLYGDDRCGAARVWQGEGPVKNPLFPTEKPGDPPKSYTPGQDPAPVQLSWTDNLVLAGNPNDLPYPEIKQFSGPMWTPLVALSRVTWAAAGKAIVKHTLSIEVKRPK